MIVILIVGAASIPAFVLPRDTSIVVGLALEQICGESAYAVVPVYLLELVPFEHRSATIGTVYEIDNLVASALPTIVAALAQRFRLTKVEKQPNAPHFDYGKSMTILLACVYPCMIPLICFGPEKRNTGALHDMVSDDQATTGDVGYRTSREHERLALIAGIPDTSDWQKKSLCYSYIY